MGRRGPHRKKAIDLAIFNSRQSGNSFKVRRTAYAPPSCVLAASTDTHACCALHWRTRALMVPPTHPHHCRQLVHAWTKFLPATDHSLCEVSSLGFLKDCIVLTGDSGGGDDYAMVEVHGTCPSRLHGPDCANPGRRPYRGGRWRGITALSLFSSTSSTSKCPHASASR